MITVKFVTPNDDIARLVDEINSAAWDSRNDMCTFDAAALTYYLGHQGTVFLSCHDVAEGHRTLLGMASSRLEVKPYGRERWLYVDEVDVCADQRRRGAAKAMMNTLRTIAQEAGCEEMWLGTETDNVAANGLYRSLGPSEVDAFVGYNYVLHE